MTFKALYDDDSTATMMTRDGKSRCECEPKQFIAAVHAYRISLGRSIYWKHASAMRALRSLNPPRPLPAECFLLFYVAEVPQHLLLILQRLSPCKIGPLNSFTIKEPVVRHCTLAFRD